MTENLLYARAILIFKILCIVGLVLLVAFIAFLPKEKPHKLQSYDDAFTSDIKKNRKIQDEADISINNLVFSGMSQDKLPYKILANSAERFNGNNYNLDNIKGLYNLLGNTTISIFSKKGKINEMDKTITLDDKVQLEYDGYVLNAQDVIIDLKNSKAESKHEVEIKKDHSIIRADSFNTTNKSNKIILNGNVHATFDTNDFND